jgi:hypothetical protein
VSSLTSLLEYPRSMQSVVRDSLALHPPQPREKRYAQGVHLRTDERPAFRHAGARVVNSKLTRKEALKLLGGGLAATALGVGFSAEEAEALSRIKPGVFPYRLANPNLPTLVGGFRAFTNGVNHKPFYFAAWTDFYKQQAGALYDWYEQDILKAAKTLDVHLFLSLEVRSKQPEYSFRDLWRGAPTAAGIDPDEYVMNVAQHLKSWTDRTGHVVPVRMLHEFNCPSLSNGWGGPEYMPRFWRRWATILRGGDVDSKLRAMGQPALRTTKSVARNDNLLFVWNILVGATAETNWSEYWPGAQWVDMCGADMFPSPDDANRKVQFAMLNRFDDFARNHSKPLCFPEFNWAAHKEIDRPGPTRELLDWIVRHASRVRFTAQFETTRDFAVVQRGDPHPELRKLYSNYYNKSVFREDS